MRTWQLISLKRITFTRRTSLSGQDNRINSAGTQLQFYARTSIEGSGRLVADSHGFSAVAIYFQSVSRNLKFFTKDRTIVGLLDYR